MDSQKKYVEVILPLPLDGSFTYSLREDHYVVIGQRVIVPFGRRKIYTAIVIDIHNSKPELYQAKEILEVLDQENIVSEIQIEFWRWISSYYMSRLGDVMNVAMPSSLKLASESIITIHPYFDGDIAGFSDKENIIITELALKEELSIDQITILLNQKSVFPILNEMIRKEIIEIQEDLRDNFKLKKIQVIEFSGDDFGTYFEKVKSAKKQRELLIMLQGYSVQFPKKKWLVSEVLKRSGINRGVLNALVKKGILIVKSQEVSRLTSIPRRVNPLNILSEKQQKSFTEIKTSFHHHDVCLLHGITSSGKTEIYIKLIQEQLDEGRQVLYLLPEIALTEQIINRLKNHFGNLVGVSHSKLSNSERVEVWNAVKETDESKVRYKVVLGARSSLFLPFTNLGLVVVDEEHDPSFKQHQTSPRYHARDASIYLASLHKAKVLLGSATPSLEAYYNTQNNKFGLVELNSRFRDIRLPKIHIIDIRKAHLKKQMEYHFSPFLIKNISEALDKGKQIILFQNRRGYAPILECNLCNWSPACMNCDVSLTYHKYSNLLKCHYCGYNTERLIVCKACKHNEMIDKGFGTEQIEEELKMLFPSARTQRMDYDTTRKKYAYKQIINDFERGIVDILIGTQMITKGLDFDNVEVVGILNADNMLKFPDFRAFERAYQLMSQVSGRAGRKGERGKVIIQTYDHNHEIIDQVKQNNYLMMYTTQLEERKIFKYPPYIKMILITLQHRDERKLDIFSKKFALSMRKSFDHRVLGPESPSISKIRNYYHKNILLKIELGLSVTRAKDILGTLIEKFKEIKEFRSIRVNIDVDPN